MVDVAGKEDAFTLAEPVWFDNVRSSLFGAVVARPVVPQIRRLRGQHPRLGEKIVLLGEVFDHTHKVARQEVLFAELLDASVHVNFLPWV